MEPWSPFYSNLRDVLVGLFNSEELAREITLDAEMDPSDIVMRGTLRNVWFNIVNYARTHEMIEELIDTAIRRVPKSVALRNAKERKLSAVESPADIHDVKWKGDVDQLEKVIGTENTLLPIGFLEVGLERARSVARIQTTDPKGHPAHGTGFLLKNNWVLTNHHVLSTGKQAAAAVVQFNYEQTGTGLEKSAVPFQISAGAGCFHTSEEFDWTLVKLVGDANADWGAITLKPTSISKANRVIIIQHPSGGLKQIALTHNVVTFADDKIVQYLTDTLPGSSGSPVFDEQWNVVALHHSGGWLREPGSKTELFRNEGIAIARVLDGIQGIIG